MNAAHTPTPRTDAERLKRELDSYQKEIPDCIQSAKDAHLQNWEQLSIIGVLRRFPQICHWYKTSERELAEAQKLAEERERHMKELRSHYGIGPRDVMGELRKELAEVMKQRDALAAKCRALLDSEEVQKAWPHDGLNRAEKPKETHSSATATVKFRRLLAIHSALATLEGRGE